MRVRSSREVLSKYRIELQSRLKWKIAMARMLLSTLAFGFLVGVLPISNHMTMQIMQMGEVAISQHGNMADENSAGDRSAMPCCDDIAQTFTGCAFLVPQYSSVGASKGSERVAYSTLLIQTIYIEILAPPPKS